MNKLKKYKFDELYDLSSGISTSKEQAGHGFPFISFSTIFNNYFIPDTLPDLMETSRSEQEKYSVLAGDVLLTRTSETLDELAMSSVALKDYPNATFSGFAKRLRPKHSNFPDPKFMAFYLRGSYFRRSINSLATMTTRASFNETLFSFLSLELPDINTQVAIGNLLFNLEKKIQANKKLNDNLQQQLCLIYENMMSKSQTGSIDGLFTVASKLTDVVTGNEDANFSSPQGKYKFFTCSKDSLNCNEYVFDASAILIAGNGDFNVKHYTGKFNAYQRTYVLIPNPQYYSLLYLASLYQINAFKSASTGSIVKFITKGDIENIPVFIPNDEYILDALNRLIMLQEKKQSENDELSSLRDWLLPMLMNGQATIED